ncbi:MAG: MaoC family dehydratase [Woeseiaceae bacterium]|nr:MaoC family dehydratase [Woeseiaceae bacterium]
MPPITLDSLSIGDTLPPLTVKPISRTTLALYAGASGDHNPIHLDIDFAKRFGLDDVIAHGMLIMAYAGRMLTDWVPQSALQRFGVRFSAMTAVHDEITCTGTVTAKHEDGTVHVDLQAADQRGDIKLAGEAVLRLAA